MKTKQFIKEIKSMGFDVEETCEMGFDVEETYDILAIFDDNETLIATVPKEEFAGLVTNYLGFYRLDYNTKLRLLNLLIKYAKTPVEDRKEEEKYYYRLKGFNTLIDKYLARGKISNDFYLVSQYEKEDYNTQFTDKEFETFPEDIKSHNWGKIKVECED